MDWQKLARWGLNAILLGICIGGTIWMGSELVISYNNKETFTKMDVFSNKTMSLPNFTLVIDDMAGQWIGFFMQLIDSEFNITDTKRLLSEDLFNKIFENVTTDSFSQDFRLSFCEISEIGWHPRLLAFVYLYLKAEHS